MKRILIVDDDRALRRTIQIMMERLGYDSVGVESGRAALEQLKVEKFDLVLTDLKMPEMTGVELIKEIRAFDERLPVIVMTAYGTIQTAIEAMRNGAFDYVLKPYDNHALEQIIRKALDLQRYESESRFLKEQLGDVWSDHHLRNLPGMRETVSLIEKVSPTSSAVLITGETGTGKEIAARAIHALSPRRDSLFVPINCAALPAELLESELFGHTRGAFTGAHKDREGKFETANGGTLFLDEIGDMPLPLQSKLLRVLEDGVIEPVGSNRRTRVDVRLISATNQNLQEAVDGQRFRRDLYYRINTFEVHLPPLRARPSDVEVLCRLFLQSFALEVGRPPVELPANAIDRLERYRWPGNVRELRNQMERIAVLSTSSVFDPRLIAFAPDEVTPPSAPMGNEGDQPLPTLEWAVGATLQDATNSLERRIILRALDEANDNKAEAARRLGISERNLWYKLKKHKL